MDHIDGLQNRVSSYPMDKDDETDTYIPRCLGRVLVNSSRVDRAVLSIHSPSAADASLDMWWVIPVCLQGSYQR
jgi:hypothetical protein